MQNDVEFDNYDQKCKYYQNLVNIWTDGEGVFKEKFDGIIYYDVNDKRKFANKSRMESYKTLQE